MQCRHVRIKADRTLNLEHIAKRESIVSTGEELGNVPDE